VSYDPYQPREAEPEYQYSPVKHGITFKELLRKLWAPIAAVVFAIWKLKFIFAAIFKFKLFTVAGSMLVSIGAYALLWGWQFAVGFVLLLFVHELGHVIEAKRQGLPASAPMFIPFLGALITLKQMPENAWNEAKVAIAGPILGGLGAAAVWGVGEAADSELLVALGFTGFFLNLFNLAPISPLDGGRIVAAIHPALWIVGLITRS
jgi:Zn-dependent protease